MGTKKGYKIVPQVLGLGGAKGLGLLSGLIFMSLASRNLDEARFSRLLTHLASLGFAGIFASTGTMTDWLRRAGKGCPRLAFQALGRRAGLRAGLGFGLYVLLLVAIRPSLSPSFVLAGLWLLSLPMALAAGPSLLKGDTHSLALAQALGRIFTLGCALSLYALRVQDPGLWLMAHALGLSAQEGILFWRLPKYLKKAYLGPPPKDLGMGELWISLGDLVRSGYHQGAQLLASMMMGVPFPLFGAPHRLYAQAGLLPSMMATIMQGPFSTHRTDQARARLRALLLPMLAAGILTSAALAGPAKIWISLLFPTLEDPSKAAATLRILALALPFSFIAGILVPYRLARGRDRSILLISILGLAFMVIGFCSAQQPETFAWILVGTEAWILLGSIFLPSPISAFEISGQDG